MRSTPRELALFTLPLMINAVSLADMTPRAENLPSDCEKVYTAPIPGCTDTDFQSGQCSQPCIYSLEALVTPIKMACGNDGITGQNLIVAFLADVGPGQICANGPQMWTGGPPTSGAPFPTSMPSTSTAKATATTTKKTTVTSGVLTASSIKSFDSSTLIVDTSKTPTTGALSEQTSTSGALPGQLNTNDHSGGGSPFDTAGNMGGAASLSFSAAISVLSAALALFNNFR